MWIGTQYGLNRFDGEEFKIFTRENLPGLEFNSIHEIFSEEDGLLWLVKTNEKYDSPFTNIRINIFDPKLRKAIPWAEYFDNKLPLQEKEISYITQLENGSIFMMAYEGRKCFAYSSEHGFQPFELAEEIRAVAGIVLQKDGGHLIYGYGFEGEGGMEMLFKVDKNGELLSSVFTSSIKEISKEDQIKSHEQPWLDLPLINELDPSLTDSISELSEMGNDIHSSGFDVDRQLLWAIKSDELQVLNTNGELVFKIKDEAFLLGVRNILFDGNRTWLTRGKSGLSIITYKSEKFENLSFFENIFENSMRGIYEDKKSKLWISTIHGYGYVSARGGLNRLGVKGNFTPFLEDEKGNIWYVDKNDTLAKYDPETAISKQYSGSDFGIVWSLFETDEGEIWIGSEYQLYAFNPATEKFAIKGPLFSETGQRTKYYHFQRKDNQSIWACTDKGLLLLNMNGQKVAIYNNEAEGGFYLPAKDFRHFHLDDKGSIWLATGDAGLIKRSGNNFEQYSVNEGFPSNSLHAVYEDEYGYLWMSSDDGLIQFDKQTKLVQKYFKEDGLLDNEFNRIAHFQGDDGRLFFGGLKGLTSFHPKDFSHKRYDSKAPNLALAEFEQYSKNAGKFEDRTADLLANQKIVLQPGDQFFYLKLSLLDFEHRENSVYHYRIKGLFDWQSTTNNEISFSGLPYGNYELEIRAKNGNRREAANLLNYKIRVLRPFYFQWWFFALLFLFAAIGVYFFIQRRTQQLAFKQEAIQLKKLDEMKTRLFANVSHELRTPLTLISLPLENLIRNIQYFSLEEIKSQLESINGSKKELTSLIDEIMNLSKLAEGQLNLNIKPVHLSSFLERVICAFHSSASVKNVDFQYTLFVDEKTVAEMDVPKMEMVINNLISNALKYTESGGKIAVYATWESEKGLHLKIQDSGRGISEEDLPHIFERYFQTKRADKIYEGGTGIGLAICKEYIGLMGGDVHVESELGKGSTFSFVAPIKATESKIEKEIISKSPVQHLPSIENIERAIKSNAKPTVLIVEDHQILREHLVEIISKKYFSVTANNGLEALKVLEKASNENELPALILSDVMMPLMDGFSLLENVKTDDRYCAIPFILLTARADETDKLYGLRIGVDAYMTKPFVAEELLLRMGNLLANVQNRTWTEEVISENESEQISVSIPAEQVLKSSDTPPAISKEDLDWLAQVEAIALRVIKNSNYSVEDLAKDLTTSRRQVFRRIKKTTGLTPKKYFNAIRLRKALTILETEKPLTLTEVCYAVGFENTTHFANLFEAEFGKRPHDFLKKENA